MHRFLTRTAWYVRMAHMYDAARINDLKGRDIWFALCGWEPWYADPAMGGGNKLGNSWRCGPDTSAFLSQPAAARACWCRCCVSERRRLCVGADGSVLLLACAVAAVRTHVRTIVLCHDGRTTSSLGLEGGD
jgi:hypothetical protein